MLKKAGIVVAAAAAGLLAVSPLAFAGDKGDYDHGHGGHHSAQVNNAEKNSSGLVNVSGNDINVPIQACNDNVDVLNLIPISDVTADLSGALALLGRADNNSTNTIDRSCTQAANAGDTANQAN